MRRRSSNRGFTLVEVIVGSALGLIVMSALLSSFVYIGRSLSRLASYQALENEARKGLVYLRRDFASATAIKSGTTPTSATVTLVLPAAEVTYTYDATQRRLRRQAMTGPAADLYFLQTANCLCTAFAFSYYTTTDGAATSQASATTIVPYSVKQIEVSFTLESPTDWSSERRTRFEAASSRFLIRNRNPPDGT